MKMRTLWAFASVMVVLLFFAAASGNHAFAKKYKPGEIPTVGSVAEQKKKMIDDARKLAEESKQKALEKIQKEPTTTKKDNTSKKDALDAAKAEMKKKTDAALAAYKASKGLK